MIYTLNWWLIMKDLKKKDVLKTLSDNKCKPTDVQLKTIKASETECHVSKDGKRQGSLDHETDKMFYFKCP